MGRRQPVPCPTCGMSMSSDGCATCAFGWWCEHWEMPKPAREVRFWPKRRFRFDFAWRKYKVAVEIQGGIYMRRGGHNTAKGLIAGYEKMNGALALGWRVYQFTPKQVITGEAHQWLADHGVLAEQLADKVGIKKKPGKTK